MTTSHDAEPPASGVGARFSPTHWSVVLTAQASGSPGADAAWETLAGTYWYPVYAFLRRQGWSQHDAEDLTQGFFLHLLEHRTLERVTREKGRFRSFLLSCLKYYVADHRAYQQRQKRGGGRTLIALDSIGAEERYRLEPRDHRTPEQLFERRYALAVLDRVLDRLREEQTGAEHTQFFEALQPFLVAREGCETYAALAARLGRSEEAVKKAVQRMRRRYQELFREEIARTVSSPEEGEDELRHLRYVVSNR
ncbi:MAG: sigma-70 family RNA polymerase sigma factor [Verrucomicrobiales bacterium]|nr:sigma-70 family RNA polymerase sigma factor [Verrucomicrobiales bacterium]